MKSEYNAPPNRERLVERLRQIGCEVPENATAQQIADVINVSLADQAVCSRAVIDGKRWCFSFANYWERVFNLKWKYVPHDQRGLMTEGELRKELAR